MPSICEICGRAMRPGVNCFDRAPLETWALEDVLKPGDDCRDCNAPVTGNHHDQCKFLWCPEHDVQFMLCAKDHRPPTVH
jgi:hypothetical protein